MHYDLYFAPRQSEVVFTPEEFDAYFRDRPHYSIMGTNAIYHNEDTGVQFLFVYERIECEDENLEAVEEDRSSVASFYMNYLRPHFFIREAIPEIEAFIDTFKMIVEDPHEGGMGRGDFSREIFIREWDRNNRQEYQAFLKQQGNQDSIYCYPTEELDRIWKWNQNRETYQDSLGEHIYVPLITFVSTKQGAKTVTAWTDAISIALPKVDIVLMPRQKLAPKRLFWRKIDITVSDWEEIKTKVGDYPLKHDPIEHYILNYTEPPEALENYVINKEPIREPLEVLPFGQILNKEIIDDILNK